MVLLKSEVFEFNLARKGHPEVHMFRALLSELPKTLADVIHQHVFEKSDRIPQILIRSEKTGTVLEFKLHSIGPRGTWKRGLNLRFAWFEPTHPELIEEDTELRVFIYNDY